MFSEYEVRHVEQSPFSVDAVKAYAQKDSNTLATSLNTLSPNAAVSDYGVERPSLCNCGSLLIFPLVWGRLLLPISQRRLRKDDEYLQIMSGNFHRSWQRNIHWYAGKHENKQRRATTDHKSAHTTA